MEYNRESYDTGKNASPSRFRQDNYIAATSVIEARAIDRASLIVRSHAEKRREADIRLD